MRQQDLFFNDCPLPFPTDRWRGFGLHAADGDTVTVKFDRGFFGETTFTLRLSNIDCWEKNSGPLWARTLGKEAEEFTNAMITARWLNIKTTMDREKYGRILAQIFVPRNGDYTNMVDLAVLLDLNGYRKDPSRL